MRVLLILLVAFAALASVSAVNPTLELTVDGSTPSQLFPYFNEPTMTPRQFYNTYSNQIAQKDTHIIAVARLKGGGTYLINVVDKEADGNGGNFAFDLNCLSQTCDGATGVVLDDTNENTNVCSNNGNTCSFSWVFISQYKDGLVYGPIATEFELTTQTVSALNIDTVKFAGPHPTNAGIITYFPISLMSLVHLKGLPLPTGPATVKVEVNGVVTPLPSMDFSSYTPTDFYLAYGDQISAPNTHVLAIVKLQGGTYLLNVVDDKTDGTGGELKYSLVCNQFTCTGAKEVHADDANDPHEIEKYGNSANFNWVFAGNYKDGNVFGPIQSCFSLTTQTQAGSTGIDHVVYAYQSPLGDFVNVDLGLNDAVTLTPVQPCTPANIDPVTLDNTVGNPFVVHVNGVPQTAYIFNNVFETAAEWYHYDSPDRDSANTVRDVERSSTHVIAFVQGSDGLAIVNILDKPNDGSGGTAHLDINCVNGDCMTGTSLLEDDPHTADSRDSYTCTPGECAWKWEWNACCTDGLVYGPVAPGGCIDLRLRLRSSTGLTKMGIVYPTSTTTHDYLEFDLVNGVGPEVTIQGLCDVGIIPPDPCCPPDSTTFVASDQYDDKRDGVYKVTTREAGSNCARLVFNE